jgi:dTMP kinase
MISESDLEGKDIVNPTSTVADGAVRGVFVVFEGIDGSGKSTISKRVFDRLDLELPGRVVLTSEPSDSWIGDCVRRANAEGVSGQAEALLFVADRAEHTRQIQKWLQEGKVVICDRYFYSTLAYQGAALKQTMGAKNAVEWLQKVNEPVVISPDLTLLLTIKVGAALERVQDRGKRTKFERLDYLMDVDLIYRMLAMEDPDVCTLDASRPSEEVVQSALTLIRNKL